MIREWLANPEVIGPAECPILLRWTIGGDRLMARAPVKLLVHKFPPRADDRDVHDHPRAFLTLCLAGGYDDLNPCGCVGGYVPAGALPVAVWMKRHGPGELRDADAWAVCPRCEGSQLRIGDRVRRGALRYRPALHRHRTRAGSGGALTVVVMGPKVREWGFHVGGGWLPWRVYRDRFGPSMRCP